MELIFLKRLNLAILDHAFVSDDFYLIVDSVIYQKSYFVINKGFINASIGDIVILRDTVYFYIGIIETLEKINDYQTKVQTNDFTAIFDIKIPISSFSGDLCAYLVDILKLYFKQNDDELQNIEYLIIETNSYQEGSVTYDKAEIVSITSLCEMLAKAYGIRLSYQLMINDYGQLSGIKIFITTVTRGIKIKSNLPCMTNLEITDSQSQVTNKITFYPKDDNVTYKKVVSYYLLMDGTISLDKNNLQRYNYVKSSSVIYSDNEYSSLLTKAQNELLKSNLEHSIEFKVNMDNKIIIPFKNLKLGDFVQFITRDKVYDTMVTQLSFKGNFYECTVVLGEYRVKLTDKIKLLERK